MLVVDDEPDFEILIRQRFKKHVNENLYAFDFAYNGIQAFDKIKSDPSIEFVLTDINMPQMDGLTLLSKLNELKRDALKTVIVSAYGDMDNIRVAMNRGAFDFITKPINFDDLEITIKRTLEEITTIKNASKVKDELVALQRELTIASQIQQTILPKKFPQHQEGKEFEIYASMIPAKEIGGDFYDFFPIGTNKLGFVIGDVSGKGVPAALFMAVSRTTLKVIASNGVSPAECLTEVNRLLCPESDSQMFVTIFYGVLDLQTGELVYSSGGHNPPYFLRSTGDAESLKCETGTLLGMIEGVAFDERKITMEPGESIFLYTDGVTEAMNSTNDLFTEKRLEHFLQNKSGLSTEQLIHDMYQEINKHTVDAPQSDDITIMMIKYLGPTVA